MGSKFTMRKDEDTLACSWVQRLPCCISEERGCFNLSTSASLCLRMWLFCNRFQLRLRYRAFREQRTVVATESSATSSPVSTSTSTLLSLTSIYCYILSVPGLLGFHTLLRYGTCHIQLRSHLETQPTSPAKSPVYILYI